MNFKALRRTVRSPDDASEICDFSTGKTLLHLAAEKGFIKGIRYLLRKGVDMWILRSGTPTAAPRSI